jgi:hypothetical protein
VSQKENILLNNVKNPHPNHCKYNDFSGNNRVCVSRSSKGNIGLLEEIITILKGSLISILREKTKKTRNEKIYCVRGELCFSNKIL